jgi:hypothetical protein
LSIVRGRNIKPASRARGSRGGRRRKLIGRIKVDRSRHV